MRPNLVFDGELTLSLNRRRIQLHDWGRANSPHDVTVYLPDDQLLFTGDILVQDPLPYTGASWPVPWAEVLRRVEAMPVRVLVPGHGPVMRDQACTRQVRGLLEATTSRVAALALRGLTLDQIQSTIDPGDVRRDVPAWNTPAAETDWVPVIQVLVERAGRGVRGQG